MIRGVHQELGFGLVEVLAAIVIVGILGTVSLHNYAPVIQQARIAVDMHQGRLIKEAVDVFYATQGRFPASIAELQGYELLGYMVTAQRVGQELIIVNDDSLGSPVFSIDLAKGRIKVRDVSTEQQGKVVWDSN